MKKLFIICLLAFLLALPLMAAEPGFKFKQGDNVNFSIQVFNSDNSKATAATDCYFTLKDPDTNVLINDQLMDFNSGGFYGYWINSYNTINASGEYPASVRCDDGSDYGRTTFTIAFTPTGDEQGPIWDNPILLIFLVLGIVLLILGILFKLGALGFLGGVMFMIGGIYTMIYGFNNITDLYTRSVAGVLIGLGFIISLIAAYEVVTD